jgi:hypothetical protein
LPIFGLVYVRTIVDLSSIIYHLFWEIIAYISRLFCKPISWIERIAINIVILILNLILFWSSLLILPVLNKLIILRIRISKACKKCGWIVSLSDHIFRHVAYSWFSAKDIISTKAVHFVNFILCLLLNN